MRAMSILKLGNHGKSNKRIWIANQDILKAGFKVGDSIRVDYDPQSKKVEVVSDSNGRMSVSGRNENSPIIDIKNADVANTLGRPEKIEVQFYSNRIVISVAKSEAKREQRSQKTGRRMFELFCGGGTLHHHFKNAGFVSAGGLEMSDKYIAVFNENNPEKDVVTICSAIEDVEPSDYPSNVDLVIAGIPCTQFSQGHLILQQELSNLKKGIEADPNVIAKRYEAEALVFHVLNAIQSMNPRTVVIEEVEQFAQSPASMLLRTVLGQWGYNLTETVAQAKHTKRKRWCLVADMNNTVDLNDLAMDDGKTINDFLTVPVQDRDWKTVEQSKRFAKASSTVGLRSHSPDEVKTNTFTTHSTRSTEPCLRHPTKELYSEFTNDEIANIHGLEGFVLSGVKTIDRQILGQGVACMFADIAVRVALSMNQQPVKEIELEPGQMNLFCA